MAVAEGVKVCVGGGVFEAVGVGCVAVGVKVAVAVGVLVENSPPKDFDPVATTTMMMTPIKAKIPASTPRTNGITF